MAKKSANGSRRHSSSSVVSRKPKEAVKRQLRREVGFGCPIVERGQRCGSPFLEWHHFDPEWHVENHMRPAGMIALCSHHHNRAGGGEYTVQQLHKFKAEALVQSRDPAGPFGWLRQEIIVVTGGGILRSKGTILELDRRKLVWFNRDADGYMLLNVRMLTMSGKPRFLLEDNFWVAEGSPVDIVCPPQKAQIEVRYENGDRLTLELRDIHSADEAREKHPGVSEGAWDSLTFPLTSVDVMMMAPGAEVQLGTKEMRIGSNRFYGCSFENLGGGPAIVVDNTPVKPGGSRSIGS